MPEPDDSAAPDKSADPDDSAVPDDSAEPCGAEPDGAGSDDSGAAGGSGPGDRPGCGDGLTGLQRRMLDFERRWWRYPGAKEQAIRDEFGMSATRYYQLLNGLLAAPAAMAADPVTVGRLRRLRESRRRSLRGR